MKVFLLHTFVIIAFLLQACAVNLNNNEHITEVYFQEILNSNDKANMGLFFSLMPKGGDIHHHYSGALYAETYLDWAAKKGQCISTDSYQLIACNEDDDQVITIDSLKRNTRLYRTILEAWSDINFSDHYHHETEPDLQFFNTFSYFGEISGSFYRNGLENIKKRAVDENVQYVETMINAPPTNTTFRQSQIDSIKNYQNKNDTINLVKTFELMEQAIISNPTYDSSITAYIDSLHKYHEGIDDLDFKLRYQTYAVRTLNPGVVFGQLYSGFDATSRDTSNLIVGVNIVAPENGLVSLQDYRLHMQMFRFLKTKFPTVKTAMHAGELHVGMVKPEDLTFHIHDAVFIAKANRIGHGVDIPYENQPIKILEKMKVDSIAIEINLTSNEFILGVYGNDHPIKIYYDFGVPVIIATDDAGVSRNSLTTEYVKLASRYQFKYTQIKGIVFNSIQFSFLNPEEKSQVTSRLIQKFEKFEDEITQIIAD